jgi:alkaline phosphatase
VRDLQEVRKTKNVILFIGDGMTTNMISAARLIAHKTVNGKYQTNMQLDKFPVLGHQMTHSLDTFITDSANSASALYTGHKSSVNCLGVYADSSESPFDDPKVETIAELFYRLTGGHVGIVSTAYIADATPAGLTAHTRDRGQYGHVVDTFLNGITNYTWTDWEGPDVLFGGGAEQFYSPELGGETYEDKDYYEEFAKKGYQVLWNATSLDAASTSEKALGIFTVSNMAKWLDRNVYKANLNQSLSPSGDKTPALDQPGLKEMTLKALDILHERSGDKGFFLMSEAASIDKMMHALDYDRALGELLELDDTVKATINKLKEYGCENDTLVLVTADHGHGFDVMGSVDTQYLAAQNTDRKKRDAVGTYEQSGLSQYVNTGNLTYTDSNFPSTWDPRYTLFQGQSYYRYHLVTAYR